MKTISKEIKIIAGLLLGLIVSVTAQAEGLTVAGYVELSQVRLQKVKDILEQENRALNSSEQEELWRQYGTTMEEFVSYRSKHQKEVDAYLSAHPELTRKINSLSVRIDEIIAEGEAQ